MWGAYGRLNVLEIHKQRPAHESTDPGKTAHGRKDLGAVYADDPDYEDVAAALVRG
jgi:hypothetical protein